MTKTFIITTVKEMKCIQTRKVKSMKEAASQLNRVINAGLVQGMYEIKLKWNPRTTRFEATMTRLRRA